MPLYLKFSLKLFKYQNYNFSVTYVRLLYNVLFDEILQKYQLFIHICLQTQNKIIIR